MEAWATAGQVCVQGSSVPARRCCACVHSTCLQARTAHGSSRSSCSASLLADISFLPLGGCQCATLSSCSVSRLKVLCSAWGVAATAAVNAAAGEGVVLERKGTEAAVEASSARRRLRGPTCAVVDRRPGGRLEVLDAQQCRPVKAVGVSLPSVGPRAVPSKASAHHERALAALLGGGRQRPQHVLGRVAPPCRRVAARHAGGRPQQLLRKVFAQTDQCALDHVLHLQPGRRGTGV